MAALEEPLKKDYPVKNFSIYFMIALLAFAVGVGCDKGADESAEGSEAAAVEAPEAGEAPTEQAQSPLVVKAHELAKLRKDIKANPDQVDALLAKAELTEESLDALLFEIAQDPEASAAYAGAR